MVSYNKLIFKIIGPCESISPIGMIYNCFLILVKRYQFLTFRIFNLDTLSEYIKCFKTNIQIYTY